MSPEPSLLWSDALQLGYYPCDKFTTEVVYDKSYFDKYTTYESQEIGKEINNARVKLIQRYQTKDDHAGVDIGIGCGTFINSVGNWLGYDVNQTGIDYLKNTNRYFDIYTDNNPNVSSFSFWDSFEHIKDLDKISNILPSHIFISIPIFSDLSHILKSKHFRKDEHYWYFTDTSLITYFSLYGYECVETNKMESELGREDIETFVFIRKELE